MTFLQNKRKSKAKKDVSLPEQSIGEELLSLFVYVTATIVYFIRKNVGNGLALTFILFYVFYSIYKKFFNKTGTTDMIGGIEVPKIKDNYDLSLD